MAKGKSATTRFISGCKNEDAVYIRLIFHSALSMHVPNADEDLSDVCGSKLSSGRIREFLGYL